MEYCSLASGSSGNAHYLASKKTKILVDVGMSAKYIREALGSVGVHLNDINAIVITHGHIDHVRGLKVLAKRTSVPIYIHRTTYEYLLPRLEELSIDRFTFFEEGRMIVQDMEVEAFQVPHDAFKTFGFRFTDGKKTLGLATDLGEMEDKALKALISSDFLVLESNHDENMVRMGPYPYRLKQRILGELGHLSNARAAQSIRTIYEQEGKLRFVLLAHLSEQNNYPDLAYMTTHAHLKEHKIHAGRDLQVEVAPRKNPSGVYRLL